MRAPFRIPTWPGIGSIPRSRSVLRIHITPRLPSGCLLVITPTDAAAGPFQDNASRFNFPDGSTPAAVPDEPSRSSVADSTMTHTNHRHCYRPQRLCPDISRPASSGTLPPLELRALRPDHRRGASRTLRGHRGEDALYDALTQADAQTSRPTQAGFFRDAAT